MREKNSAKNPAESVHRNLSGGGAFSFVKGVKNKILEAIFRESPQPQEEIIKQLEQAKIEIANLQATKENLQSKWILMTKRFNDESSIGEELKKIDDENKVLAGEISRNEERVRALYASKDDCLKELEQTRENLKELLEEKRTIQDDVAILRKNEAEAVEFKKELAVARSREETAAKAFEEVGMKLRFANANMETLVLDSAVAKKALDDLERVVETKNEAIKSEERTSSAIEQVLEGLDELIRAKDRAGDTFETSKTDLDKLKKVREVLKSVEGEHSTIPKKIAELNVMGAKGKERAELIKREKSLAAEVERLQAEEKNLARKVEKNKSVLEEVETATLKLKRLMVSANFHDYISRVDSASPDILKVDIEKRMLELVNSLDAHKKELVQAQNEQSQKRIGITRMRDELDKLTKGAERDKSEVELQREKLKKIKNQSSGLRKELEAKLKEKSAGASLSVSVSVEMKRIESLEADAVGSINRIEADIDSLDHTAGEMLSALGEEKARFEELAEMERFFRGKFDVMQELQRLKSVESELSFSQEVAAKYEADLRKLTGVEKQKRLLEVKLTLVDETLAPIPVMESRLLEMSEERSRLDEELAPLRSELDFAFEKRDNVEMEASFAREALKNAREREKSLRRRLEFVTKESGSLKNIQDKLALCENRLTVAQKNITEIQTRLNFTTATEDVVKEKFQNSEDSLKEIEQEINSFNDQIEEKEALLPELRQKLSNYESQFDNEQGTRIEAETTQSRLRTELKKTTIECDALTEKIGSLDAAYQEYKEKERAIEDIEPSYNTNLQKHKKLDAEITIMGKEIDNQQSQIGDMKAQITELQAKKRQLMEKTLESSGEDEPTAEVSEDLGKRDSLRDQRRAIRGKIKETEAKIKEVDKSFVGKTDTEKVEAREVVDSLRRERDDLHKRIDRINEELDTLKEGGKVKVESGPEKGEAKELAQAIGEGDIKLLICTKSLSKFEPELEAKRDQLKRLTNIRDEFELELENQKNIISALDETKRKIESLEKEKDSAHESFVDKTNQKELLTQKAQEADQRMETSLKNIEELQKGLNQVRLEIEVIEGTNAALKNKHGVSLRNKERTFAEFSRLRDETNSIMNNIVKDREMVEKEKNTTENARREVEDVKKQLGEAMNILTGKAGSIDSLKLEVSSSAEEEEDISDRIENLEIEFKSSRAAIEGIEFNLEPKAQRLKYIVWAQELIEQKINNSKLQVNLAKTNKKLKDLEEARYLFDEYKDLARTKQELKERVGELKSYLGLEAQLITAEQARREAMTLASESAEKLEVQEALVNSLEERYKSVQEEKLGIKGRLGEVTRQFESSKALWGEIEDLSRIKDSVELKIHQFRDKFGDMETASVRVERLEKQKGELTQGLSSLEAKCRILEEEKESLEQSLTKSRDDFESVFVLLKKTRDEAKNFLSSSRV